MNRLALEIGEVTCGHCVGAVTRELRQLAGVTVAEEGYEPRIQGRQA